MMLENISDFLLAWDWFVFNNYSPKAKLILSSNPRDEVEGIIRQYSLSLRGIIVLVQFQSWTTENKGLKHKKKHAVVRLHRSNVTVEFYWYAYYTCTSIVNQFTHRVQ